MEITTENYFELKNTGISRAEIANILDIPEWKLKHLISKNKWSDPKPLVSNTKVFQEYSEDSCYWAGFLAADGNVDLKGRIRIMLQYSDYDHLLKFKKFLGSTHKIGTNTSVYNRCSFEFTNKDMCEDLDLNFNIIPNKTDKLEFPKFIPDDLIRHYIRGYFDGDGSICESFSNKNSITATLYATITSGSENFTVEMYNFINSKLNTVGHLQKFTDSNKFQIKYNTNDAKSLLSYMYSDSEYYLDRKYELFEKIVINNNRLVR